MSKIKVSASELQNREIVAKIKYGMEKQQITHEELAIAARITKQTLYHRYKKPDQFRLDELRKISAKIHIPVTELITYQK